MKTCFFLLVFSVITLRIAAAYKGYYDCSDDDCAFYEFSGDPRNPYLDLYLKVEGGLNHTRMGLPNWKMGLEFYDGYLYLDTNSFDDECGCPLILEEDKAFITFHASNFLDVWYSYKFPISEDKDGALQISCDYKFSALLVNETNHAPTFLKVEVYYLNIFNFTPYGIPMKWIDNLPEKYIDLIKKAIYSPVKKLLEDTLLQAFNQHLNKLYKPELHWVHDNSVLN